jgi:excisionase family DNA binding protein
VAVLEPKVSVVLDGLEEFVRSIVKEEVAALTERESDRWLTSDEAAEYLGIARSTLHDLVCDGRLPRHGEKGHRLRFRQSELDAYLDSRGRRP